MKTKIMVIGSYAVGMTMKTNRLPRQGETVMGNSFVQIAGGKGSNQAIAAVRLGADVIFYTCLGLDPMGEAALRMYESEGINASLIKRTADSSTGVGFVIVDGEGNNSIVIDLAANLEIYPSDIKSIEQSISKCDALLLQNEINIEAVKEAIIIAKKNDVKIIYDPAPFTPIEDKYLEMADIITPNEHEAAMLLGYKDESDHAEMARALAKKGVGAVIITLGENGCLICEKGNIRVLPAPKVVPVDSTGAGDTFSAALAVALGEGATLDEAAEFANKAASTSVTKYGVAESIPYRSQII